jgi:hypothetical protein
MQLCNTVKTMLANQALRKTQLLATQKETQIIEAIRSILTIVDPGVQILSLEKLL